MKQAQPLLGALLVFLMGLVAVRLALSGEYLNYVKQSMRWWLAGAGAVLLVIGGAALGLTGTAHHHGRTPVVAAFLLPPILTISLLVPTAGPWLAERSSNQIGASSAETPLPTDGTLDMRLDDYVAHAIYGNRNELLGREVKLVGFVTTDPQGRGWYVNRLKVNCCLADALPMRALVLTDERMPEKAWVEVLAEHSEPEGDMPRVKAVNVTLIDAPDDPLLS